MYFSLATGRLLFYVLLVDTCSVLFYMLLEDRRCSVLFYILLLDTACSVLLPMLLADIICSILSHMILLLDISMQWTVLRVIARYEKVTFFNLKCSFFQEVLPSDWAKTIL